MPNQYSDNAAIQTDQLSQPEFPPLGEVWRWSPNDDYATNCADMRASANGVYEIVNTGAVAGESWSVNYDGVLIPFTTAATVGATALAIKAALQTVFGTGKALEEDVSAIDTSAGATTISFATGANHEITLVPPPGATATFTNAYTTSPSLAHDHEPGYWVAIDTSGYDPQMVRVKQPDSASDVIYGLVVLEGALPTTHDGAPGPVGAAWPAGRPMKVARRAQRISRADGAVGQADVGQLVYAVVRGARKGWSRKDAGGAHQVTRGDVVFNGTDPVGVTVDALPTLSVPSNTSDDLTAADLRDAWNNSAQHAAVATATIDTSGSESWFILTFADYGAHTVLPYSPATADVVSISDTTAAVAAVAVPTKSTFITPAEDGDGVAVQVNQL